MEVIVNNWHFLFDGLMIALKVFIFSTVISTITGIILGVIRTTKILPLSLLSRLFVEVFRGLPVVVTMFFVFFAVPIALGLNIPSIPAAIIGLSLWCLSEIAEIVRGAIQSIPKGQYEAGKSMAFTNTQLMRYIILPQATRRMLPPLIGVYIRLLKGTALASLIGVRDLMWYSRIIVERTYASFEIFGLVMLIYFVVCYPLSVLGLKLERKFVV